MLLLQAVSDSTSEFVTSAFVIPPLSWGGFSDHSADWHLGLLPGHTFVCHYSQKIMNDGGGRRTA